MKIDVVEALCIVTVAVGVAALVGCRQKSESSPSESAGVAERTSVALDRAADKTVEATVEATGDVAAKTTEVVKQAAAATKDATGQAVGKTSEVLEKAGLDDAAYIYRDRLKSGDKEFLKGLAQRWFFNKDPVGLPVLEEGNQALLNAQNKVVGFTTTVKEDDIKDLQGKYGNENVTLKIDESLCIDVQRRQILDAGGKLLLNEFVGVAAVPAQARTWTERTGRKLDAEFIGFADGKVRIKRSSDQKTFDVPIERLSDADQAFVRSQVQADPPGGFDGKASNAGMADVNKVPDATGHPAWQEDFDAFVLAYQDAIRKDAPSCNGVFAGKRVRWTLNFRDLSTSAGKVEIVFDGVRRKITKGGLTGPWAQFFPSETTIAKWKSLPKGTRVSVSGTIVRAAGGEVTDNVTAEKVPWGVAEVNIDEPKTAPSPEREGLRYSPKRLPKEDAAMKIVSDPEIAKWEQTFQSLRKFADAGFPGEIDIVNSDATDTTTPGPSVEYIVKRYGPADSSEVKKSQITGLERIYYWYGSLGIIVSKKDNQIWGFAGTPPKTTLGK